jgi:WD40 repeat protein
MKLFSHIKSPILGLVFTPQGDRLLATAQRWQTIGMWNLPEGTFRRWHPYADCAVRAVAFSSDGYYLAVGNQWGMVLPYYWAQENYDGEWHASAPIDGMAFAPRRALLAIASYQVTLWCLDEGTSLEDEMQTLGGDDSYWAVCFSPDGKKVAASRYTTPEFEVWDLDDGLHADHDDYGWYDLPQKSLSLAFSPDGQTLAVASGSEVLLYDVHSGKKRWKKRGRLAGHTGVITQLAYQPGGHLLATGSRDQTVRFWDMRQQREVTSFDWGIGKVRCLTFAPDGMTCAAGGDSGRVALWDVDS